MAKPDIFPQLEVACSRGAGPSVLSELSVHFLAQIPVHQTYNLFTHLLRFGLLNFIFEILITCVCGTSV